jgi:hypothetical protein
VNWLPEGWLLSIENSNQKAGFAGIATRLLGMLES